MEKGGDTLTICSCTSTNPHCSINGFNLRAISNSLPNLLLASFTRSCQRDVSVVEKSLLLNNHPSYSCISSKPPGLRFARHCWKSWRQSAMAPTMPRPWMRSKVSSAR